MEKIIYHILIVEDEWINAAFTKEALLALGHHVVGIYSSSDAILPVIKSNQQIDIVFMDININGSIDGINLAKHISSIRDIPIVYITAFSDSTTLDEACETNIYGFITKPYTKLDIEVSLGVAFQRILKEKEKEKKDSIKHETNTRLELGNAYYYDLGNARLYHKGKYIQCTNNESKLLHLFCCHYNRVVSLDEIRLTIWRDKDIGISAIRDTILRIRKKLPQIHIESVSGIGYILKKHDVSQ